MSSEKVRVTGTKREAIVLAKQIIAAAERLP